MHEVGQPVKKGGQADASGKKLSNSVTPVGFGNLPALCNLKTRCLPTRALEAGILSTKPELGCAQALLT
jgi:hypothetical protein